MILRILLALFSLCGVVLLFHPNESRLPDILDDQGTSTEPLQPLVSRQFSALNGDLSLRQVPVASSAGETLSVWAKSWPSESEAFDVRVQAGSARFVNPAQVRVSLGIYPGRVESRDGIFVPPGGSMAVVMPDGYSGVLKFSIAAIPGDLAFEARLDDGLVSTWVDESTVIQRAIRMAGAIAPGSTRSALRLYMQFIRPRVAAQIVTGARWRDFAVNVDASPKKTRELRLTCSGGSPCVFGDMRFLRDEPRFSRVPERRENFLIVLVDTLRADAVLGDLAPETFREFNASAAVFSSAMSPGNMTSPSTNALLSCHTPTEIRDVAFAYAVSSDQREAWYRKGVGSFPRILARHGYHTAMIGNISVISEAIGVGVDHGFSENISIETEGYETPLAAREAARWIHLNRNAPFLLYVHLNAPHGPYKAPLADVWRTWPGWSALASMDSGLKWLYRAEVRQAARAFQRILDSLDSEGLGNKTNVILLADHGDQHTSHRFHHNESGPVYSGAYFDHGATLLTDEVGVPLSWRGPGVMPARHRVPVSTIGTGPALLRKSQLPDKSCGESSRNAGEAIVSRLAGTGTGTGTGAGMPAPFGLEGYQQRGVVFDGRWKYIRAHEPTIKKMVPAGGWKVFPSEVFIREELYDLESDPAENVNMTGDGDYSRSAQILQRARAEYESFYGVDTGFELVVEAPHGEMIRVPALDFESRDQKRVVIPLPASFGLKGLRSLRDLKVQVDGKPIPVDAMAWRLPLNDKHWAVLPREIRGEGSLLPVSHEPNAYLRRVLVNDAEVRRIVSGNPMFDQILREWGYLHDD